MSSRPPQLQPRLRFPHPGVGAFGQGKSELLRHSAATGSIRSAASDLGISCSCAWQHLTGCNTLFRTPLVTFACSGLGSADPAAAANAENLKRRLRRLRG